MASKKISDLTAASQLDSADLIPVVDSSAVETKKLTGQQLLEYVTGSVLNSLSASVLSGSETFTSILTASYITGSDAKFTSITASSITANEYNVVTVNRTTLSQEGSTKFGDDSLDIHQFTGSVSIDGNISGSDAKFSTMSGNLDWSYIINEPTFLEGNETITLSGDAVGSGETSISVSEISASFIKVGTDGTNLTNLTASQLTDFTTDVRAQFTAGTNITIIGGEISSTAAASGDVVAASDNTFTATNTFNNFYITASAGITGSDGKFSSLTSSFFNSESPAVFVNSAGVTGTTPAFSFKTDSSVSGYLFELRNNTQQALSVRYDGYTYIGDTLAVRNALLLSTPTLGSTQIASYRNYLKNARFIASGSNATAAVRIGSENNLTSEKLLSVGRNLYNASPVDVVDVYGNGDVDISGSLIANVRLSGSVASPIDVTSYTISAEDRGKTLLFSSSVTQNITCSSGLDVGYNCTFVQMGSGQLILSGASGVELLNRQSHTGSAGQYAAVSVIVIDTDKIIIAGDTV